MTWMMLIAMLLVILVAAEIFTNALEHLGERLKISDGVTGSIFAAVGTAMPESMVPLVAIFAGTADAQINAEIGVGAILGAPLMLSTLTFGLLGFSVMYKRGTTGVLNPERHGLRRDLHFFLIAYGISLASLFVPHETRLMRVMLALVLLFVYFIYVLMTLRVSAQLVADGHGTKAHSEMFLCRLGLPDSWTVLIVQLAGGFLILVSGAKGFVTSVEAISSNFHISPLLLALILIPVATELPETMNSFLWVRRHKDTLAFGNITGAMVFQGSLLPAIGIVLTPWTPRVEVLSGVVVTVIAAGWITVLAHRGQLRIWHLFVNGALYAGFIAFVSMF